MLTEGNLMDTNNNKIENIRLFSSILEPKYLTNSYKIYWIYGIYEEIKRGNKKITFKNLVFRMISKSWYSITAFKLNLGHLDKLNEIVIYLNNYYEIPNSISENELLIKLKEIEKYDKKLQLFAEKLTRYVPYRLLSPFLPETKGIKDNLKNDLIVQLSNTNPNIFYKILNSEKAIVINDFWFNYIYENQKIIESWILNKLILFLQSKNPNVPSIPLKIFPPKKRNLKTPKEFWLKVIKLKPFYDIYTNTPIDLNNLSIDHFIPWSFVLHDQLWNLIPTHKEINSKKSDHLPSLKKYLENFCKIQYIGFKTAIENQFSPKLLEDYYVILKEDYLLKNIAEDTFTKKLKENIIPLYQIAENQGFTVWEF